MLRHCVLPLIAAGLFAVLPGNVYGSIFTGSSTNSETGTNLSAKAEFTVDASGNLVITLTNTGANAVAPSDILTALFFDLNATLTPVSALLDGSIVIHGTTPADGNVGGEWAFESGLSGAPGGATKGVSAVGFGLFGQANFNGSALFTPPNDLQLDGLDAGIVSSSQTDAGSNAKVKKIELIKDHVTFTLSGAAGVDASTVTNVSFQFGTDLSLPNIRGVEEGPGPAPAPPPPEAADVIPEPSSVVVWLLGCGGLGLLLRRRMNKTPA